MDDKPDNSQDKKNDDKKSFKSLHEEQKIAENQLYFEKIRNLRKNSKNLIQKAEKERKRVQEMLKLKKAKLTTAKNKEEKNLISADCRFLQSALSELPRIEAEITGDITTLNLILASKIKMPYRVLVDFELKPLPSEKNKDKDKDKDKDKNKNKDKNKDTGKESGKDGKAPQDQSAKPQINSEDLRLLRNGINKNIMPTEPEKHPTTPQNNSNSNSKKLQSFLEGGRS